VSKKDFPNWAKKWKIVSVEEATQALEAAPTQPEWRMIKVEKPKSDPSLSR
jgi:hypothetical protein